ERSSSGGTQRSSPHHSVVRLQSGCSAAARSYAGPGAEPPVRTIAPPRPACSASRSPTRTAGSSTTWSSTSGGMTQGYETSGEPGEEVHAREPAPFAVRREQLVRLLGLDPPAPERRGELRKPEIALQPVLVSAEALQADDAERPRAEPQPRELRRREPGEIRRGRGGMQLAERGRRRPDDAALDRPRAARLDQLACDGAQKRLRDRARAHRAEAAQPADGLREQRVACEAAQELRMVVGEAEREAHVLDARLALRRDDDRAVRPLQRMHALESRAGADRRPVRAVDDHAGRVARMPAG